MEYKIENTITAKEYNELRNSVGWESKDENIIETALQNSVVVKKITSNKQAIGMARAIGDGLYYLIVDVVVHNEYQGKGIGKLLIEEIVKFVEDRTKVGQKSSINLISMKGKEEFYEKCGFRKIPFDYTGYGMTKRIEK
ncbi:MAG TPA: GNAT family N-acetyltransferase [Clostridiales bacterium]|nr:GNAT family N-acetyltransferase [Clostridiales bacterium]